MTDQRIETAAKALYEYDRNASASPDSWPSWENPDNNGRDIGRDMARAALAAADNAATITTVEDLLSTRAGLALANTAYGEGARDMLRECNSDDPVFTKPMNPYSGPLLRMIRESRGTE